MQTHRISRHSFEIQHFPAPDAEVVICRNLYSDTQLLASTNIVRGLQSQIFPANGTQPQQWILSGHGIASADGENPDPREDTRNVSFGPTSSTMGIREIEITIHNETTDDDAESSLLISATPEGDTPFSLCTLVAKGSQMLTFRIPFREPAAGYVDDETGLVVGSIPRIDNIALYLGPQVGVANNPVINATILSQ